MNEPLLNTRYLVTETDPMRLAASERDVAFVGRSNAGKSSLICALCKNKKLARVSKIPGRTRGVVVFEVVRGRWLMDFPGYGFAAVPDREKDYWPKMIGLTLGGRTSLVCVYVLLDAERGVTPIDRSLLEWLGDNKIPYRLVGTKVDRLNASRQREARYQLAQNLGLEPEEIFWVSSKAGYGLNELRAEVARALGF